MCETMNIPIGWETWCKDCVLFCGLSLEPSILENPTFEEWLQNVMEKQMDWVFYESASGFTGALHLGPLSDQYLHGYNPLTNERHMMNHNMNIKNTGDTTVLIQPPHQVVKLLS